MRRQAKSRFRSPVGRYAGWERNACERVNAGVQSEQERLPSQARRRCEGCCCTRLPFSMLLPLKIEATSLRKRKQGAVSVPATLTAGNWHATQPRGRTC